MPSSGRSLLCAALLILVSGTSATPEGEPETAPSPICGVIALDLVEQAGGPGMCDRDRLFALIAAAATQRPTLDMAYLHPATGAASNTDRESLSSPIFQPRRDVSPWPVRFPIDWAVDPFQDRNWRYQLNAWRLIDAHLLRYDRHQEPQHFQFALRVVTDWMVFHQDPGHAHSFAWHDMAVALRTMRLAYMLDRGFRGVPGVGAADLERLVALGDLHLDRLLAWDSISQSNYGLFQLHGATALCRALPEYGRCHGADAFVQSQMAKLLPGQFNVEFMHLEHSPQYHFFVISALRRFLASGWYTHRPHLGTLLDLVEDNGRWLIHPDGELVRVGDTSTGRRPSASPPGDPQCRIVEGYRGACYLDRAFYRTGYAVVRSDWAVEPDRASMLFFMAAFHSRVHKHADDLSFELFEHGRPLILDGGLYAYDQDEMRSYITSARAHNTVEIGGGSAPVESRRPYGSGLDGLHRFPWGFVLEGSVMHADPTTHHRRILVYRPREWLVVLDRLEAEIDTSFTQWLHFHPDLDVSESNATTTALVSEGVRLSLKQTASLDACQASLVKGQREPRLQGWRALTYRRVVPSSAHGFSCHGRNATMVSVLLFHGAERSPLPLRVEFSGSTGISLDFGADTAVHLRIALDAIGQTAVRIAPVTPG